MRCLGVVVPFPNKADLDGLNLGGDGTVLAQWEAVVKAFTLWADSRNHSLQCYETVPKNL